MDHLSMVAKAAKAAGMSYGKYVALQYELGRNPVPPALKRLIAEETEEPEERRCEICGALLRPGIRGTVNTCGPVCSYELNKRRNREYYQKTMKFKPGAPVKCDYCEAEFLQNRRGQRFCSPKCNEAHKAAVRRGIASPKAKSNRMENRSYGTGECVICGEMFTKRSARQMTCSKECRRAHSSKVRKDK